MTPAGRKRYVKILFKNLHREKSSFDRWDVWVNTNVKSDVEYLRSLSFDYPWINLVELPGSNNASNWNIHKFFPYAMDSQSVYVRLDDDVVWLESGFFDKLVEHRLRNVGPFLVYANIVNNAVISHIHQRNGLIEHPTICDYCCTDRVGWKCPLFAEKVHRHFIADLSRGRFEDWHGSFKRWVLWGYERVSINAVSWLGRDMATIGGLVDRDEEEFLSVTLPRRLGRPNEIFGGAVASHFAFYTQRSHMDSTDLLFLYSCLASLKSTSEARSSLFPIHL